MTPPRRRSRTLGLAVTIALTAATAAGLAGCAGPSSSAELRPADSPLVKRLGSLVGFGDSDALRTQTRKAEEATARCMKDRGFEYKPFDWSGSVVSAQEQLNRPDEKWIAKNGYGIAAEPSETTDPNSAYIDTLSDTERDAYFEALYGQQPAETSPTGGGVEIREADELPDVEYDPETAGCNAVGQREASGGKGNFWEDKKYSKLLEKASGIRDTVDKQPQTKAAATKWSDCMASAGFSDMKVKDDARGYAAEKYQALYGSSGKEGEDLAEVAEPSAAELRSFRALEIKVALADFRCDKKSDYSNVQLKAQFELEKKFIEENSQKLDELVEAYGDTK